ncbi:hypothetical protein [Mesorhizobium sp. M1216]|uniref:hypothetical protein n=1 Tax=Mesorhizobium sp. M1216 TaxID=2957069 RepID=UPI003339D834
MKLTSNKTLMASTALAFALGLCAAPPLAAAQEPEKKGAAAKADRPVKVPQQTRTGQNEPTVLDLITISATMIKTRSSNRWPPSAPSIRKSSNASSPTPPPTCSAPRPALPPR